LEVTSPKELHLIDPWKFQSNFPNRRYGGKTVDDQEGMDAIYQSVKNRFQTNRNVKIHRNFSATVLKKFEDHYFDWIYIDANHFYDYILKDLEISFKKVKPNGLITGDDYTWGRKKGFPVRRAVQDFTEERKIKENTEIINSQFIIRLS
jgi:predicted O-methyltransferase YrrM